MRPSLLFLLLMLLGFKTSALAGLLLLTGAIARAQAPTPLPTHAVRSINPTDTDFRDLEFLRAEIGPARVVMLGEPSHGEGNVTEAKIRLVRYLHEQMGFTTVAFESGFYDLHKAQQALEAGRSVNLEIDILARYLKRMTDAARPILRGEASITLRKDTIDKAMPRIAVKTQVSEEDASLLSALKAKRRALAEAAGVPAYVIFADKTLIEMAEIRPKSLDTMMGITGVGAKKLESYGAAFLQIITGAATAPMHPARRALVGRDAGAVYDLLNKVQVHLARGDDGIGKHLSCAQSTLRHIAERRPSTLAELANIQGMGDQKTDRFGAAFLEVLREG